MVGVIHVLRGSCTILYEHKYLNTNKTYEGTQSKLDVAQDTGDTSLKNFIMRTCKCNKTLIF